MLIVDRWLMLIVDCCWLLIVDCCWLLIVDCCPVLILECTKYGRWLSTAAECWTQSAEGGGRFVLTECSPRVPAQRSCFDESTAPLTPNTVYHQKPQTSTGGRCFTPHKHRNYTAKKNRVRDGSFIYLVQCCSVAPGAGYAIVWHDDWWDWWWMRDSDTALFLSFFPRRCHNQEQGKHTTRINAMPIP